MLSIRRIIGQSMQPTLKEGQIVISIKRKRYKVGQIVIARQNNKEVIKRVSEVYGGYYNLLGDNLAKSTDSRQYGLVKDNDILGRLIFAL